MRILPLSLLLTLLLAACSDPPPAPRPIRAVRTVTVQSGQGTALHEFAAEIRARTESRLAFRVNGQLVQRLANLGDHVAAGQPLARIDAADLKLGQDAARAALQAANAQLALSETEFLRFKELRDLGFISGLELERRETALKASRAQAEQARAQATMQGRQADYAVLTADAPGVVTAVDADPGAVLAAGAPVLRLAHDGPRDAVFSVPEDRIDAFRALAGKPGALRLRLWEAGGAAMPVQVREVAAAADPMTRTFLVKADVGKVAVRLGQTASVVLASSSPVPVIKLPLTAVFSHQGRSTVWLVDPATMTLRVQPVVVGGAEGNQVLVAGGLVPGQVVVVAGVHVLTPGETVRWYVEPGAAVAAPGGQLAASAPAPAAQPPASAPAAQTPASAAAVAGSR